MRESARGKVGGEQFISLVPKRLISFAPPGLVQSPLYHPRLAPWAAFFRRSAAGAALERLPALDDFLVGGLGVHVPLPGVFEGHDLGAGAGAVLFSEEDVGC